MFFPKVPGLRATLSHPKPSFGTSKQKEVQPDEEFYGLGPPRYLTKNTKK